MDTFEGSWFSFRTRSWMTESGEGGEQAVGGPDGTDAGPVGWCVCGQKVTIEGAQEITLPNGRDGWEGRCPECGAPLFAIRRKPKAT
ncbi:MAG: hypothetical protein QOH12_2076 [Solirubrobacteraceae bacterium]|nr:hypothetical protein [Solirubrobacteraceae bacterium]